MQGFRRQEGQASNRLVARARLSARKGRNLEPGNTEQLVSQYS